MQTVKWITASTALIFLASCFFPWVVIESKNIIVSGVDATGTTWGKPGYLSILLIFIYLVMTFIPTNWAHRIALFVSALNLGWIMRNFFMLSFCQGGECPNRQPALWVYLISGCLLLLLVLLRKVKLPASEDEVPAA